MPSRETPSSAAHLAVVDRLTVAAFPDRTRPPGKGKEWSGPGYHLAVLQESQDFWEDRGEEIVEAAERDIEDARLALDAALTDRWGEPEVVDLWPYLGLDDAGPDVVAPEPMSFLCGVAGSVRVWRLPSTGRWLGLAVGQADPEWPVQLLAAVGEDAALPR